MPSRIRTHRQGEVAHWLVQEIVVTVAIFDVSKVIARGEIRHPMLRKRVSNWKAIGAIQFQVQHGGVGVLAIN